MCAREVAIALTLCALGVPRLLSRSPLLSNAIVTAFTIHRDSKEQRFPYQVLVKEMNKRRCEDRVGLDFSKYHLGL